MKRWPGTARDRRSDAKPTLRLSAWTVAGTGLPSTTTATETARATVGSAVSTVRESSRNPVPMPVPEQVLASTRTVPERTRSKTAGKSAGGAVVVAVVGWSLGNDTVGRSDGSVVGGPPVDGAGALVAGAEGVVLG